MEYKKGDMVMLLDTPPDYDGIDKRNFKRGRIGKIIEINRESPSYYYGILWQGKIDKGHNCSMLGMPFNCWRVPRDIVKKII